MMRESNIEAVERYLDALRSKDLSRAPLAADVIFSDPLTTEQAGVEAWQGFISPMLPAFKDVRIKQHIADGAHVVTMWEADTVWGIIPILEYFRVEDGKIKEARAFFDPRPIRND
jgi:limonene-1,2-epoxide hydrolase